MARLVVLLLAVVVGSAVTLTGVVVVGTKAVVVGTSAVVVGTKAVVVGTKGVVVGTKAVVVGRRVPPVVSGRMVERVSMARVAPRAFVDWETMIVSPSIH